jgi:hypothetical protein
VSSVASFFRVTRADLETGPGIVELLERSTDLGDDYGWSGYAMLNLLMVLEELGVNLGAGLADEIEADDEEAVRFFATSADLAAIEGLDPNQLDEESLGDGLGLDDDELREAMVESITFLHQLIAGTAPHEVLVIDIG